MNKAEHRQCYDVNSSPNVVAQCILEGHPTLVLMRGLPGSGKSTLARELADLSEDGIIFSTDDFFYDKKGNYCFDPNNLEEFHRKNVIRARDAIKNDKRLVIVDNTNINIDHMKQYVHHAVTHFYEIYVVEPETSWKYKINECFKHCIHGVDKNKISQMREQFHTYGKVTLATLIGKNHRISISSTGIVDKNNLSTPPGLSPSEKNVSVGCEASFPTFAMDSSLISSGSKNCGEKGASSFVSLAFSEKQSCKEIEMRTIGTQFSQVMISLHEAEIPTNVAEFTDHGKYIKIVKNNKNKHEACTKDRPAPTMADSTPIPLLSDLDILVSLFPEEDQQQTKHYYERLGLQGVIKVYNEAEFSSNHNAVVEEGAFVTALFGDSVIVKGVDDDDEAAHDANVDDGDDDDDTFDRLYPKSNEDLSKYDLEKISVLDDKLIRVKFSELSKSLSMLFGTGDGSDMPEYMSLNVSFLLNLYRKAQSDLQLERDAIEKTDTSLARELQAQLNREDKPRRLTTMAQRMQYLSLIEDFPLCDSDRLLELFVDSNLNSEHTRAILIAEFGETSRSPPPIPQGLIVPARANLYRRSTNDLAKARIESAKLFELADSFALKKKEQTQKANNVGRKNPSYLYYVKQAGEFARTEKSYRDEGYRIIRDINLTSSVLDFHGLIPKDAIDILQIRLAAIDSPGKDRKPHNCQKLYVITGAGYTAGSKGTIRSCVVDYLKKHGYLFSNVNPGAVIIYSK